MYQTSLTINRIACEVSITEESFSFTQSDQKTIIQSEDILGFDHEPTKETRSVCMHYIHNGDQKLENKMLTVEGPNENLQQVVSMVTENVSKVPDRPKSIVIFLNPSGGSANSESLFRSKVEPILKLASIKYNLIVSESPNHPKEFIKSFDLTPYDVLAIMGGDGTFNIIMTGLLLKRQSENGVDVNDPHKTLEPLDIPVAFIPAGTGNGMAQVAYGGNDVTSATLHIIRGKTKSTSVYGNYCEDKLVAYSFLMTATGMFVELIKATETYRWMRKLRYLFVPAYFFLIKSQRQFDVEIQYEELMEPDGTVDTTKSQGAEKETILCAFLVNSDSVFAPERKSREEYISVILYKPTSKWQMCKNFVALSMKANFETFERNPSIKINLAKGVRFNIKNPDPDIDYSINSDGEVYDMSKPEVYVKLIPNAYKLITAQSVTKEET